LVGTGTPLKIVAPLVTTTYYGRWETGCGPSACKDVLVTVRPQPIALDSVTSNHNDFCAGTVTNLVLKAYGGLGEQLEWYADSCGGAVLGLGNQITVPAPDTITTYYARWMNSCDTTICESILINVFPQPVAPDSISADNNNYCSGSVGIVTLTAFGGSGDTLFWYQDACNEPSIGYSTTPSTLLINAPTETTTYFARYKNNCGESVCTSFTLNVIPQPMIPDTLTVDTNYFCQAYNGIIILNGFGGVGDTLKWYNGSCNGIYEGKGTELRIPAPDTTTWYFAKWMNPCGESLCDSILVVVNEPIAVDSVYADDTLFCFNDPGQLTLVAAGGYGQQINWYKNGCGTAVVGTGDTLVLNSPTITTTYFARWENYCGITECDSVKVTVIPEAIKPDYIETDTNYFCPGSVANINLTAVGGLGDTTSTLGDTLRWFMGSCGGTEIGTGLSINIPAPVVTSKYYARWENTCGVSECTEIEIVVDIPFPVTAVSVDTNNFCPGAVTDITLMSTGGYGTSLKWYKYENGAYVNLATGQPLNVFAPDTTTTYYVRWENVCGQSAWDSIVVVVNEPFAPPVLAADSNGYCSDYGLPLQLSGIGGNGDTLRWFTQSCGGIELGTGNPLTITAPTETTTLYARYENVCGVSECSSFILNVVPAPTLFAGTLDSVCEAGAYTIANTWAENHTSILWTTTGTGTFDDATSLTPVYTLGNDDVVDQDTVHLVMSVQGMSPCGIYADTLTLLINPLPVIGFMPSDTAICRDSSLVVLTSGAMTYNWRPLTGINQVNDQLFVANPSQSTNYKVIGTSASGCVDSTDYNITVHPTPVVNLGEDQYLFTCEPVVLNAGSGSGSEQYEWQDGSVKQTFKVEENGTYWVKVSNDGCYTIDTITVQICEGYIWMPTAFTPNNDGVNEVFLARSSDLTIKFQMYIYSRNGLLIFQTDDISAGWDGRDLKGEMCNSGVYVWKVVYQGDGIKSPGVEKTQSGVVTLIR
jgi:gliding motility-associated-like protein